jgi:hypothetical protein
MNTLEMFVLVWFWWLILCVFSVRHLMWPVQHRTMTDWLMVIAYGLNFIFSTFILLNYVTHPALIQPLPAWQSWLVWVSVALIISVLVRIAATSVRRRRQLGR